MNALVKIDNYAISTRAAQVNRLFERNLGDEKLTASDFQRISVPTQGNTLWMIQTAEGQQGVKDITGIILFKNTNRSFWEKEMGSGENAAPDCQSFDGLCGKLRDGYPKLDIGSDYGPGGVCEYCKMNKWGSGKNGGKACREFRCLYMLRENDILPVIVKAPATSLRPLKDYFVKLLNAGIDYSGVITKLELTEEKNKAGTKYSIIKPSMVGLLDPESLKKVEVFFTSIRGSIERVQRDVEVHEDAPKSDPENVCGTTKSEVPF